MKPQQIIDYLTQKRVLLAAKDGQLSISYADDSAKAALSADIVAQLRQHKTRLLALLAQPSAPQDEAQQLAINAVDRSRFDSHPLSFAQARLWFIHQFERPVAGQTAPKSAYNMPFGYLVEGPFDAALAKQALWLLIERHEILRTVYLQLDDEPRQRILSTIQAKDKFDFCVFDLSQTGAVGEVTELRQRHASQWFDLSEDLPISAAYIQLANNSEGVNQGILLLNLHHIACDGWSLELLSEQFSRCYSAMAQGQNGAAALPQAALQYVDFAHWQRQHGEQTQARELAFWRKQLADLPVVHNLALDKPRPAKQSHQGLRVDSFIDADLLAQLQGVAKAKQMTLFMLLHGALSLLLSRYSASNDIVIGTVVANRVDARLEQMLGCFINTLVLRTNCDIRGVDEFLNHVRDVNLSAQAHQNLPFEQLVEHFQLPRTSAHTPMFQIMLAMNNMATSHNEAASHNQQTQISPLNASSPYVEANEILSAKFDLELTAEQGSDGMALTWLYDSALFEHRSIEQMSNNLITLLGNMTDAATSTADWLMLTGGQIEQLQQGDGVAPAAPLAQGLLLSQIEATVQTNPDLIALEMAGGNSLTYRELALKSDNLAAQIKARLGDKTGLVGVCLERSLDMVVALLAVLKAGAAYVPLDPQYPKARLDMVIEDGQLDMLLSADHQLMVNTPVNSDFTPAQPAQDDLAYVIFTSGSTGRPKGVSVSHGALANFIGAMSAKLNEQQPLLTKGKRWLALTTIAFDIAGLELWGPLCCGATVVLASGGDKLSPARLDALLQQDIDLMQATPSLWQVLLDQDWQGRENLTALCGGEALGLSLASNLGAKVAQLFNCYGPTEATIWSMVRQVQNPQDLNLSGTLLGYRHLVLDSQLSVVPIGGVGELHIGGSALATGYLANEALTAERFITTPSHLNSKLLGPRLYKTADLVKVVATADGVAWQYIGRNDQQVKLNGFRIELADIKMQLLTSAQVKQAVVKVDGKRLVAFVEPVNGESLDIDQLRAHMARALPEYMQPSAYQMVTTWPLTDNGKINQNALQLNESLLDETPWVEPEGEIEQQLALWWTELFNLGDDEAAIGRNDDFFYRGGHSLLAIKLVGLIERHWPIAITVRSIFENPQLSALAQFINDAEGEDSTIELVAQEHIKAENGYRQLPSYAQQRLWFITQMNPDGGEYNMAYALNVEGHFDPQRAEQALVQIIERHHVLSSVYLHLSNNTQPEGNQLYQWYQPRSEAFQLKVIDLSEMAESQQQQQCRLLMSQDSAGAFDLSVDLMLRASYIKLSDTRAVLLFNLHHIASDGWSMGVLINEFVSLYQGHTLAPLALQYADYAAWQNQWLGESRLQQQLDYWQQQLAEAPALHALPLKGQRPEVKQLKGAIIDQQLDSQTCTVLQQVAQASNMTLFMLLHGVMNLVLCRHSGEAQMLIGTPVANRNHPGLSSLIGCFINTILLKGNTAHNSVAAYLSDIRQTHIDAQSHQDIPFEYLVEQCQVTRTTAHTPLFQVMLSMNTFDRSELKLDGLHFSPLSNDSVQARFDLEMICQLESDASLSWSWIYDTALFAEQQVQHFNQHMVNVLMALADSHQRGADFDRMSLAQLPMLGEKEQQQLLVLGAKQLPKPQDAPPTDFLALFTAHAALNDDATAVIASESQQLSYHQLNILANRLANVLVEQLQARGINPADGNVAVGVCFDRDAYLLVAMLAVFKAGCVYVPLDVEQPAARLNYMMQDSGVAIVLADLSAEQAGLEGCDIWLDTSKLNQQGDSHFDDIRLDANKLAYVMYTSGSTGQPKGVAVSRGAISARFQGFTSFLPFAKADIVPAIAAPTFDISLLELLYPLCCGAAVMMVNKEQVLDSKALVQQLKPCRFIHMVPSLATQWLDTLQPQDIIDYQAKLRFFATGGDKVPGSLLQRLESQLNQAQVMQFYGPTEAVLFAVCNVLGSQKNYSLGSAIDGASVYLVDGQMGLAAKGALGEICLGGALAQGYLNRQSQTSASFVNVDWTTERLYRTGDLARFDALNQLHFVGRNDGQVKIRGMRVELGEIEQVLQTLPSGLVSQAVVTTSNGQLVAYVNSKASVSGKQLSTEMATLVPAHMVPQHFIVLDSWPLTPNGKVDRKTLNAQVAEHLAAAKQNQAITLPQSETEQTLAQIWAGVINIDISQIGLEANFFDIGGHSLLISPLVEQIKQSFGVGFSIRQAFVYQQLNQCAEFIDASLDEALSQSQSEVDQMSDAEVEAMLAAMETPESTDK